MRLAWATDIHLDSVDPPGLETFLDALRGASPDALVVTGDISNAQRFVEDLTELAAGLDRPIHFVLGNHDYYGSGIASVRKRARRLHESRWDVTWLPEAGIVPLTDRAALVGHGGWADGRLGDYAGSTVLLNDYLAIDEFVELLGGPPITAALILGEAARAARQALLNRLGDEAAAFLAEILPEAFRDHERVILATHVPPFREASWYQGKVSGDEWLPHFACRAAGEALRTVMRDRPDRELTVLCGHTHGSGEVLILPNLLVRTGDARYGFPRLQDILKIG